MTANTSENKSCTIFIDGGARGNPGESGIGIVLQNKNTKKGYYYYTGHSTNNEAEYNALVKSLDIAKNSNIKNIKIYSDSELVCNQINGIYKVKNEKLIKLYKEALSLKKFFDNFSITHVKREKNKEADKLVNKAIDLKENGEMELTVAE